MEPINAPRFQIDPNRQVKQRLELQRGVGSTNYSYLPVTRSDGLKNIRDANQLSAASSQQPRSAQIVLADPPPMTHADKQPDRYINTDGLTHESGFRADRVVRVPNQWWNNKL